MTVVFKDPELAELLLRIILNKPDLTVIECKTQNDFKNLYGHSARLDIFARDSAGTDYDIEVQREDEGAAPERARFNSSLLDANVSRAGGEYKELPETYVIFITESDYFKQGLPLYTIDRYIKELSRPFNDRAHIIYVNGQNRDNTDLGRLMADFSCKEPEKFNFKELGEAAAYYKYKTKGEDFMSPVVERILERGRKKNSKEFAIKAIAMGKLTLEEIAELCDLTLDEVKALANEKTE